MGRVRGCPIYEHPTRGDTDTLYVITISGVLINTGLADLPTPSELRDVIEAWRMAP